MDADRGRTTAEIIGGLMVAIGAAGLSTDRPTISWILIIAGAVVLLIAACWPRAANLSGLRELVGELIVLRKKQGQHSTDAPHGDDVAALGALRQKGLTISWGRKQKSRRKDFGTRPLGQFLHQSEVWAEANRLVILANQALRDESH